VEKERTGHLRWKDLRGRPPAWPTMQRTAGSLEYGPCAASQSVRTSALPAGGKIGRVHAMLDVRCGSEQQLGMHGVSSAFQGEVT
jgi:hypothetical protein